MEHPLPWVEAIMFPFKGVTGEDFTGVCCNRAWHGV